MRQYIALLLFCAAAVGHVGAQPILHTKWRTWYLPITDTITMSFGADSMTVTTSTGAALLQSTFKIGKDVITLHDYAGQNMCADLAGTYHIRISADTLILVMDEDPCDARGGTLIAKRWVRVAAPAAMVSPAAETGRKKKRG